MPINVQFLNILETQLFRPEIDIRHCEKAVILSLLG
jgi:hypothetical protein